MAFRLGMIGFRKTVSSSSTNGTRYTYSSRSDDEEPLTGVTPGVRVLQDVEQVATLDMEDDVLEPDVSVRPELRVLRVIPAKYLHSH